MSAAFGAVISFFVSRFAGRSDRGATAVEYGLLLAGIAVLVALGAAALGPAIQGLFEGMAGQLETE